MDSNLSTALIALVGVVISIAGSFLTSYLTIKNRSTQARFSLSSQYSDKLLAERLSAYPEIFQVLSTFGKKIQQKDWNGDHKFADSLDLFVAFLSDYNDLNSKVGLLFSAYTVDVSYDLRKSLFLLIQSFDAESTKPMHESERLGAVVSACTQLQLAMKRDIGIFEVEAIENRPVFENYSVAKEAFRGAERLPTS